MNLKKFFRKTGFLFILIIISLEMFSCQSDNSSSQDLQALKEKTFTSETKNQLLQAVFPLPDSLALSDSQKKKSKGFKSDSSDPMEKAKGVYLAPLEALSLIDDFGEVFKEIVTFILDLDLFKTAEVGKEIEIPAGTGFSDEVAFLKIEAGQNYDWKITLEEAKIDYFLGLTILFTKTEQGIKGKFFYHEEGFSKGLTDYGFSKELKEIYKVSLTFDETESSKTLSCNFYQDKKDQKEYFEAHQRIDLTREQSEILGINGPITFLGKVTLNKDSGLYKVHGNAYCPYWEDQEKAFPGSTMNLGEGRHFYMFKALVADTEIYKGAKISIAYPLLSSELDSLWKENSGDKIFAPAYLEKMAKTYTEQIKKFADNKDDYDQEGLLGLNLNVEEEQSRAAELLKWFKGIENLESASEDDYTINVADLENFAASQMDVYEDYKSEDIRDSIEIIKYISNPFFIALDQNNETFISTYDQTNKIYHRLAYNLSEKFTWTELESESTLDFLNALDLAELDNDLYLPEEIKNINIAEITAE